MHSRSVARSIPTRLYPLTFPPAEAAKTEKPRIRSASWAFLKRLVAIYTFNLDSTAFRSRITSELTVGRRLRGRRPSQSAPTGRLPRFPTSALERRAPQVVAALKDRSFRRGRVQSEAPLLKIPRRSTQVALPKTGSESEPTARTSLPTASRVAPSSQPSSNPRYTLLGGELL